MKINFYTKRPNVVSIKWTDIIGNRINRLIMKELSLILQPLEDSKMDIKVVWDSSMKTGIYLNRISSMRFDDGSPILEMSYDDHGIVRKVKLIDDEIEIIGNLKLGDVTTFIMETRSGNYRKKLANVSSKGLEVTMYQPDTTNVPMGIHCSLNADHPEIVREYVAFDEATSLIPIYDKEHNLIGFTASTTDKSGKETNYRLHNNGAIHSMIDETTVVFRADSKEFGYHSLDDKGYPYRLVQLPDYRFYIVNRSEKALFDLNCGHWYYPIETLYSEDLLFAFDVCTIYNTGRVDYKFIDTMYDDRGHVESFVHNGKTYDCITSETVNPAGRMIYCRERISREVLFNRFYAKDSMYIIDTFEPKKDIEFVFVNLIK